MVRTAQVQTDDRNINQLQKNIVAVLDPLASNSVTQGHIVSMVMLTIGDNMFNHLLNRKLLGWFIVRKRGLASIYDKQDQNVTPTVTLALTTSASVVVDVYVF